MLASNELPDWKMRPTRTLKETSMHRNIIQDLIKLTNEDMGTLEYIARGCEKNLPGLWEAKGIMPTVSASYFFWSVEKQTWDYVFERISKNPNSPEFPYPSPLMHGMPYSKTYLSYLESKQCPENISEDTKILELKAFGLESQGNVILPLSAKRNQQYLVNLYAEMFPKRLYEEGCVDPFTIRFPRDGEVLFHRCVGQDPKDTCNTLQQATIMLGGEVVLIAVMDSDNQAFLSLDFDASVNVEDLDTDISGYSIKTRFQRAWFDLLAVYIEWLHGRNVHIIQCIHDMHKNRTVGFPNHMLANVTEAQKDKSTRVKDRVQKVQQPQINPNEKARKIRQMQTEMVEKAAQEEADELVDLRSNTIDYYKARNSLYDLLRDDRFCCLAQGQPNKLVENAATKLVSLRVEQLINYANGSIPTLENSLDSFMIKELVWNFVMAPSKRLQLCEEVLVNRESTKAMVTHWVEQFGEEVLEDMEQEGVDASTV